MVVSEAVGEITACYLEQIRQLLHYVTRGRPWRLKVPVVFLSLFQEITVLDKVCKQVFKKVQ